MTNQKIALISLTDTNYKSLGEMAHDLHSGYVGLDQRLSDLFQMAKNNKFELKDDYEAKIRTVMVHLNGKYLERKSCEVGRRLILRKEGVYNRQQKV